jgi:hypothetical protein
MIVKDLEQNGLGLIEVVFQNLPVGIEENHGVHQPVFLAEIQTDCLPDTSLEDYCCTCLLTNTVNNFPSI